MIGSGHHTVISCRLMWWVVVVIRCIHRVTVRMIHVMNLLIVRVHLLTIWATLVSGVVKMLCWWLVQMLRWRFSIVHVRIVISSLVLVAIVVAIVDCWFILDIPMTWKVLGQHNIRLILKMIDWRRRNDNQNSRWIVKPLDSFLSSHTCKLKSVWGVILLTTI